MTSYNDDFYNDYNDYYDYVPRKVHSRNAKRVKTMRVHGRGLLTVNTQARTPKKILSKISGGK